MFVFLSTPRDNQLVDQQFVNIIKLDAYKWEFLITRQLKILPIWLRLTPTTAARRLLHLKYFFIKLLFFSPSSKKKLQQQKNLFLSFSVGWDGMFQIASE